MSDDHPRPPDEAAGTSPVHGAVTTTERPEMVPPPAPEAAPEPPREPDERPPEVVALDEADTVELSLTDLRDAARAAGVEIGPDATDGDTTDSPTTGDDDVVLDPMDPRIRERRIAVTRAEGRRRLRILVAAVAVASAIGIAWLVVQSPLLAVDSVSVQGTMRETPASVRGAAGVGEGDAMVFVDAGAIVKRVERLPWVAHAKVVRDYPNDLRITVVERLPVAWVRRPSAPGAARGSGAAALVDATGRVLGEEAGTPPGLPELVGGFRAGAPGTHVRPRGYARAVSQLPDGLRAQVGAVGEEDGQAVLLLVTPPGGAPPAAEEVRLGALTEIAAKGAAALAVLDQLTKDESRVTYIDVRVPGAPATR
jgi:cell division protein FtsQ